MRQCYDVCIIGAGPHALAILSALQTPNARLSDREQKRVVRQGMAQRDRLPSVCVFDPAGEWLHDWDERFAALGIDFLRSPAWAHPDAFSQESLMEFAWREGRLHEMRDIEYSRLPNSMPEIEAGYFRLPGTSLFRDFCKTLTSALPHTMVSGRVTDIRRVDDLYEVCCAESKPASYCAKHIVLALGSGGPPNIPAAFSGLVAVTDDTEQHHVVHTSDYRRLAAFEYKDKSVLVIGGGLSATQAALKAVKCGAKRVVLCSRRPLVSRHFDLPIEFMDRRVDKNKWKEWFFVPEATREEYVRNIRSGGSVPPDYMQMLDKAVLENQLEITVNAVERAVPTDKGMLVEFTDGSSMMTSCVVLGTGGTRDCLEIPLIASMAVRFDLPLRNGLPVLDEDLQWHDRITVVGALAAGQLGPDAGNLTGARRASTICANEMGIFDELRVNTRGAILCNRFSALALVDDDSEEVG